MSNPFEKDNGTYVVLINHEEQYSLWPDFIAKPAGWTVVFPANTRKACLDYVNEHWTDMRPRSLVEA
jgi:MbtH protein